MVKMRMIVCPILPEIGQKDKEHLNVEVLEFAPGER
jgi:hypothetical protein